MCGNEEIDYIGNTKGDRGESFFSPGSSSPSDDTSEGDFSHLGAWVSADCGTTEPAMPSPQLADVVFCGI